ncbi:BQ2448_182 [Microbotryum intermedium]|uniref:BQ2448_182 protein n=1 Tax=Microbotryum intermedium TaxID=269621 RepID=A0A238F7K4_9BASI|nr:BQ2448_182 [Microbotryum intermedium]
MRYLSLLVVWGTLSLARGQATEPLSAGTATTGPSTVGLTSTSTALANGTSASTLSLPVAIATATSNSTRLVTAIIPAEFSNTAITAIAPGATGTVASGPNDSYVASAPSTQMGPSSMMLLCISAFAWLISFQS